MRCLLRVSFPVEKGNEGIKSGKLPKSLKAFVDEMKPEAAYFTAVNGRRGGIFVVDLKDPSDLPRVAEPLFLAFNAEIECAPAMKLEDLAKAGPHIESAIKKYA